MHLKAEIGISFVKKWKFVKFEIHIYINKNNTKSLNNL